MRQITVDGEVFMHRDDLCDWITQNLDCIHELDPEAATVLEDLASALEAWPGTPDSTYRIVQPTTN